MIQQKIPSLLVRTSTKNFNSEIGLCLAVLGIEKYEPTVLSTIVTIVDAFFRMLVGQKVAVLVLEYGIDHPGDMDILTKIIKPNIGILTAIDKTHALYFPTAEKIFDEKVKLLEQASDVLFYGFPLQSLIDQKVLGGDQLSFALHEDENEANIGFNAYKLWRVDEQVGSEFIVCEGEDRMTTIRTNLFGHEHAGYISLAYQITQIVALRFDIPILEEKSLPFNTDLQPGRMSLLLGKRGSLLLDSSYNASPGSMRMMIELITQMRQELFPDRQLVLCLGEMRELGSYSEDAHRVLAGHILHADKIFLVGKDTKQYLLLELEKLGYASHRIERFTDSFALGKALDQYLSEQQELSLVLFKGSQNTIFLEEAVKHLLRDSADEKKLCRQGAWWIKKKK